MRHWSVKIVGLEAQTIFIRQGMPRRKPTGPSIRIKKDCCGREMYKWVVVDTSGRVLDSGSCTSRPQAEREAAEALAALS